MILVCAGSVELTVCPPRAPCVTCLTAASVPVSGTTMHMMMAPAGRDELWMSMTRGQDPVEMTVCGKLEVYCVFVVDAML